ncbi:MAG: HupE/UreJ family protein [Chthoniobacter sp.]|uniref:HupE/UreJ family protein n=1 Tax=Chthoniobacter sp. TaxID=2510640 RepID=UPI0032A21D74
MKHARLILLLLVVLTARGFAHEVRPAYLELHQTGADTYRVLWKVPARGDDQRLSLHVEFPEGTAKASEPRVSFANNSAAERRSVKRAGSLTGGTIHIAGLSATMTDVLVRLERLDGTTQVTRLTPSAPSFVVAAVPHPAEIVHTYLVLGIEHILTGTDHLLFIFGLLLLVRGGVRLLKTITAFTVAHTVTLTLATLGFVHVPQPAVEAVIALSIVFVTLEILRSRERREHFPDRAASLAERQPWLVAFTFGLLHGLGFAGGLGEAGLPQGHIPLALLLFSIGVEIGHFAFVGTVLGTLAMARKLVLEIRPSFTTGLPARVARALPPYAIGSVAMFWVIQRLAAF